MRKLLHCILTAVLLSGCVTYKAIGLYQDKNEVLVGNIDANLLAGSSTFTLANSEGLTCNGTSTVTFIPMSLSCAGQKGEVFATCDDGSSMKGNWYATSCTTGIGYGADSNGNKITFKFGLNDKQVKAAIKEYEKSKKQAAPSNGEKKGQASQTI